MNRFERVCVAGGAGYVGSVLVPQLLDQGYHVKILDLFLYGREPLKDIAEHPHLECIEGDVRNLDKVRQALSGCDACIHLACISNDPSVELSPDLSKSVNFDSFEPFVVAAKEAGVKRFIFASSGSVYGVSDSPDVGEDHPLVPVSLYNKFKALCEPILLQHGSPSFVPVIVRPATICGYSPRQRLDLTVNILTNHAVNTGKIQVFGGSQMRPNLHMQDMVDLYCHLLRVDDSLIAGEIFNAAYQNYSVMETAEIVRKVLQQEGQEIPIYTSPSDDIRSYHLSSRKLQEKLNFVPRYTIEDAIRQLRQAFSDGRLVNPMTETRYYNVKWMKDIALA